MDTPPPSPPPLPPRPRPQLQLNLLPTPPASPPPLPPRPRPQLPLNHYGNYSPLLAPRSVQHRMPNLPEDTYTSPPPLSSRRSRPPLPLDHYTGYNSLPALCNVSQGLKLLSDLTSRSRYYRLSNWTAEKVDAAIEGQIEILAMLRMEFGQSLTPDCPNDTLGMLGHICETISFTELFYQGLNELGAHRMSRSGRDRIYDYIRDWHQFFLQKILYGTTSITVNGLILLVTLFGTLADDHFLLFAAATHAACLVFSNDSEETFCMDALWTKENKLVSFASQVARGIRTDFLALRRVQALSQSIDPMRVILQIHAPHLALHYLLSDRT
jgi:hypothetical protein